VIPDPPQRFTLDGDDALEAHLAEVCDQVHLSLSTVVPPSQLQAILLAGGYGRGEGGVLRSPHLAGDQPYNDLEFYVFTRGNALVSERRFRNALHRLGEKLSPKAGLDVEFKVLTFAKLRRSRPSMFDYDLVLGHRWIAGHEELLRGCDHHRDASRIPLHEATRLLLNRCTGLLFSAERLARPKFTEADADFVGRNLAKARLAFGDVYLAAHAQYHWSCLERHRRLTALAAPPVPADSPPSESGSSPKAPPVLGPHPLPLAQIAHLHALGVAFKLHPSRSDLPREALAAEHSELSQLAHQLWLWLEHRRLGHSFASGSDYARSRLDKCPETSGIRNRLVNFRTFGFRMPMCAKGTHYPRERLLHSLPLLLWEFPATPANPDLRSRLSWELMARASDLPGWIAAYNRLWSRFN
jgi:hypothetical protein